MTTAVTMTAAVAHLMELPAKMRYEPSLWVRLHRTLTSWPLDAIPRDWTEQRDRWEYGHAVRPGS
jgi:hypothetical protein